MPPSSAMAGAPPWSGLRCCRWGGHPLRLWTALALAAAPAWLLSTPPREGEQAPLWEVPAWMALPSAFALESGCCVRPEHR